MAERGPDDAQWLHQAIERYQKPLVGYAFRMLGDMESARDVAQDALLRLCRQRRSRVEKNLAAWLFRVCRNRCLDLLRRSPRMEHGGLEADRLDSSRIGPAERVEQEESLGRLERLMATLPDLQREALLLKFQGGLSYREIGEVMKIKTGYVGWLIHEGLRKLREAME